MMLDMAQQLIEDAREFLDEARAAHFATERESTRLEAAMNDLRDFVDNLAEQNEQLRPLVAEAMRHALDLQKQAEMLAGYMLLETRTFHNHLILNVWCANVFLM